MLQNGPGGPLGCTRQVRGHGPCGPSGLYPGAEAPGFTPYVVRGVANPATDFRRPSEFSAALQDLAYAGATDQSATQTLGRAFTEFLCKVLGQRGMNYLHGLPGQAKTTSLRPIAADYRQAYVLCPSQPTPALSVDIPIPNKPEAGFPRRVEARQTTVPPDAPMRAAGRPESCPWQNTDQLITEILDLVEEGKTEAEAREALGNWAWHAITRRHGWQEWTFEAAEVQALGWAQDAVNALERDISAAKAAQASRAQVSAEDLPPMPSDTQAMVIHLRQALDVPAGAYVDASSAMVLARDAAHLNDAVQATKGALE